MWPQFFITTILNDHGSKLWESIEQASFSDDFLYYIKLNDPSGPDSMNGNWRQHPVA